MNNKKNQYLFNYYLQKIEFFRKSDQNYEVYSDNSLKFLKHFQNQKNDAYYFNSIYSTKNLDKLILANLKDINKLNKYTIVIKQNQNKIKTSMMLIILESMIKKIKKIKLEINAAINMKEVIN